MTRAASPKLAAYAALAAFGLLAALIANRPELVVVTAPFWFALALGLAAARDPELRLRAELERERALEGENVVVNVELRSDRPVEHAELLLELPPGLFVRESANPVAFALRDGEREVRLDVECRRWGGYVLGDVHVRARDRFGFFQFERRWEERLPLKVYPREEAVRFVLRPRETQVFAGNEVSRRHGEGIEFADLRQFVPGDRIRRVNWRASARRGELWVNEHHPERNTDVVLFLDTFVEARRAAAGTLDLAVRAAASLTSAYLQQRDRVGLVSFGGVLRWFLPGSGIVQRYRVVDALLDTEIIENYAWKDIDVIPAGTLPPQALVVALSPLLDPRAVDALLDLRARGFDLAVVEVSPVPFAPPGPSQVDQLAHRIWRLGREALRARFQQAGVAVVEWREGTPLAERLEEAEGFRRFARTARG
ncbi:MAG: DUF58 domain-containing protein [Thermoleophilia bacterium]|nr:DUF58 domain-containing protein [Thermoleophilia bacterium]